MVKGKRFLHFSTQMREPTLKAFIFSTEKNFSPHFFQFSLSHYSSCRSLFSGWPQPEGQRPLSLQRRCKTPLKPFNRSIFSVRASHLIITYWQTERKYSPHFLENYFGMPSSLCFIFMLCFVSFFTTSFLFDQFPLKIIDFFTCQVMLFQSCSPISGFLI